MSSSTNISINARSMNGIITLSDGTTILEDGNIDNVNNITTNTIDTNSLNVQDITLTGSLQIPNVNDLNDGNSNLVSLLNLGKTSLINDAFYYGNTTLNNHIVNKGYVDNNFVNIAGTQTVTGAKTWTATHQFTGYLIPRLSTTNSLRIGNQSQQYQSTTITDAYNITFGANSLRGNVTNPTWNKCKRNICIGTNAGQSLTYDSGNDALPSNDNVIIGHNAGQNAFYNSSQNVLIGSMCAQNNYIKNCVFLGYNVASSVGTNLQNCVLIGSNTAPTISDKGMATVVGASNGYISNSFTVVGSSNLTSATQGNRICIVGSGNLLNSNADAFTCCIGNDNGTLQTTGFYNCYIGLNNNVASSSINGSITFGINSVIPRSNCFYIGSNHNIGQSQTYQDLCIAKKNTLFCTKEITTASYTISFEDPEYINITSGTTTTITLPTPTTSGNARWNIGAKFTLIKSYTPLTAIQINAPTGQTLRKYDSTTSITYNFSTYEAYITLVCVSSSATGTTWQIINQLKTNSQMITYPANSVPSSAITGTFSQSQITNGYLDLVSDQTIISGIKTFSNDIDTPSINNTSGNTLNIGQGGSFVNVLGDLYAININPISPNTYVSSAGLDTTNLNTDTYTSLTIGSVNQNTYLKSVITEIDFPYFDTVSAKTTGGDITFNDPVKLTSLNTDGSLTLTVGNSATSQNFNGSTFIKNAIKLESYTALSGTTNLSAPLSSYYSLTTTANGTVNLPTITSDMEGIQITFIKTSASNTYTINRGGTNTFRFINSDSSATATSISMANRFTVLRLVASQGGIWDVLLAQGFQEANTSLITTNSTISHPFFNAYSIGAHGATAITLTIPIANVYNLGTRLLFRRVASSTASVLSSIGVYPLNSFTTTTTLMTSTQYQCEIECLLLTNTPSYGWFIIRLT